MVVTICDYHFRTLTHKQLFTPAQAYGHSFLQPDIAVFRQNLAALEQLNAKWKLYHKVGQNSFRNFMVIYLSHLGTFRS